MATNPFHPCDSFQIVHLVFRSSAIVSVKKFTEFTIIRNETSSSAWH